MEEKRCSFCNVESTDNNMVIANQEGKTICETCATMVLYVISNKRKQDKEQSINTIRVKKH